MPLDPGSETLPRFIYPWIPDRKLFRGSYTPGYGISDSVTRDPGPRESGIRDTGSGISDPRYGIRDQVFRDQGSRIRDPGYRIRDQGLREQGSGIRDLGSGIRESGSRDPGS